jgi:hypothetical protein
VRAKQKRIRKAPGNAVVELHRRLEGIRRDFPDMCAVHYEPTKEDLA